MLIVVDRGDRTDDKPVFSLDVLAPATLSQSLQSVFIFHRVRTDDEHVVSLGAVAPTTVVQLCYNVILPRGGASNRRQT